jgi:BlaI family penicillinase repressor
MSESHRLGDLQLAIMRLLWQRGEATVAQVHEALQPARQLALTTIATMLRKMEDKGVVRHRADGRQFIYRPTVTQRDVHRSMIGDLIDRLFDGDARALLSHLVTEGEIDPDELAELQAIIEREQHRREGAAS